MNHIEESVKRLRGWNVERLYKAEFMAEDMLALIDVTLANCEMLKQATSRIGKNAEGNTDANV